MHKTPIYRSSRTAVALMAAASAMPVIITVVHAEEGNESYSSLAKREMIRRQNAVVEGDRLLAEGREAYASGDYQLALDKYTNAVSMVPDAPMFADRRENYIAHKSDATAALAMKYRKEGKYTEARALLEDLLKLDPNNGDAKRELGYLEDPIRTSPALTYEHTQNVDKVRRTLYTAEGHYNLGKYDDARRAYEEVIRIDPHNTAARRGLERIAVSKSDYYRAAYDHTRAELLGQVDAAWELAVPAIAPVITTSRDSGRSDDDGVAYITEKLRRIVIPRIDFEDTTVEEAIEFLRLRSAELDTLELDPTRKGVNFVVRRPRNVALGAAEGGAEGGLDAAAADALPGTGGDPGTLRIPELRVRNVPLAVALKYICDATKLRYKVDDFAVTLVPQTEAGEDVFSRSFTVPPDFQSAIDTGDKGAAAEPADPFAAGAAGGSARDLIKARPPIMQLLKNSGVTFAENASATLTGNTLLVSNTPTELDKIEQLVENITNKQPKQVKITTKFVEITQENNDELGFDWIVGPFSANSSGTVIGAGGTVGSGAARTAADISGPQIPGVPFLDAGEVTNTLTSGNRSGEYAVDRNSIDAILNNPNRSAQRNSVAPGIMSLTGLFSDGQVKMIMRGLAQKRGIDLMTAPSITAKSGQVATIEIIREFIYPTEYDAPEPGNGGGGGGRGRNNNNGNFNGGGQAVATPANPTTFETRNTGVTLEVEPTIGADDFMIDLRFVPEIVEFEGFINYGSPIQTSADRNIFSDVVNPITGLFDIIGTEQETITLTENRIEMPVFATRRVTSALTIYDGYTVAIGGLMREDIQNTEDKVPILGDIPWVGRLFQTKAENRIKSNLIIFVTAQIIDPTGRPLRGADAADSAPVAAPPAPGAAAPGGAEPGVLPPLPF